MSRIVFYTGYNNTPWNGDTLHSTGLGGTETAVVCLALEYHKAGHHAIVYGPGIQPGMCEGVTYCNDPEQLYKMCGGVIDVVVGVSYLHYALKFDKFHVGEYVFWMHNETPYLWLNGNEMTTNQIQQCVSKTSKLWVPSVYGAMCAMNSDVLKTLSPTIVPNAIDITQVVPVDLRTKYEALSHIPAAQFKIIYSSCVTRGLINILNAWPLIQSTIPQAELHIAYPAYSTNLKQSSEILQIATSDWFQGMNVHVHGSLPKPQLYELMSQSHLWLYPSDYPETFCITAIEMMAHGVSVVASNSGCLSMYEHFNIVEPFDSQHLGVHDVHHTVVQVYEKLCKDFTNSMCKLHDTGNEITSFYTWKNAYDVSIASTPSMVDVTQGFPFDALYIITDDHTAVQRQCIPADMVQRVRNLGVRGNATKIVIVPAVDGRAITSDTLAAYNLQTFNWQIPGSNNDWWNRPMTKGELGCAIAHMGVWHHAYDHGYDRSLILESDFNPVISLSGLNVDALPDDWDLLYLGRNLLPGYSDTECGLDQYVKPGPSYNLHAYAISKRGARSLVDYNFGNKLMPVDEFIPATYGPHPRADLNFIWRDISAYAVRTDHIVQHNNKNTTISGLTGPVNTGTIAVTLDMYTAVLKKLREEVVPDTATQTVLATQATNESEEVTLYSYFTNKTAWLQKYVYNSVFKADWDLIGDMPIPGVFCFDMFTPAFCEELIVEAEKQAKWTTARHEFYPTTDFLIKEIGLGEVYNELIQQYIVPAAKHYYGLEGKSWNAPSSENFMARYTPDTQSALSLHHDYSDVTALVNLSAPNDYVGGGTYFQLYKQTHVGRQGQITLHPGRISHRHGGRPVLGGKRYILVSFINSK